MLTETARNALGNELSGLQFDGIPLLSIAIWGWPGDGKTTSLLTALHYSDVMANLLGLTLVRERDELDVLAALPRFSDLGLSHVAETSNQRLTDLLERFIGESKWPDGTDVGKSYLVRVESAEKTLAFAVASDLPGGSYADNDPVAQRVIENAHAIMVMVSPQQWLAGDLDASAYQNMVRYRIRRCAERRIPASVLVAQSDVSRPAAKKVANSLTELVKRLESETPLEIFQVSVLDDEREWPQATGPGRDEAVPVPAKERDPQALVDAWTWTLIKALSAAAGTPDTRVPVIDIEQLSMSTAIGDVETMLELRRVGDFSGLSGTVLFPMGGTTSTCSFLVLRDTGTLAEITLNADGTIPRVSNLGEVDAAGALLTELSTVSEGETAGGEEERKAEEEEGKQGDDDEAEPQLAWRSSRFVGGVFRGELVVGHRKKPEKIWTGALADLVRPLSLSTEVSAWTPISPDLIAGVDDAGRLHLLGRKKDAWVQVDWIPDFVPPGDETVCAYFPPRRILFASNGQESDAVIVRDRKFGERVAPPVKLTYDDSTSVVAGRIGSVMLSNPDELELRLAVAGLGQTAMAKGAILGALGMANPGLMAWVSNDLRLHVGVSRVGGPRLSTTKLSPKLPSVPVAMDWAVGDGFLALDLGDGTWQLYRALGL